MAAQPEFYIIAGPNGAGKSTFGSLLIPPDTFYFNGDLVFADLCKRYPAIEPERLGGGVAVQLEKDRDAALAARADFAFESNYSNQLAIDISLTFREAGYKITLIYFGLPTLANTKDRVAARVEMGGHDISDEAMLFNRKEGIKRVCENLHLYDRVEFIDTRRRMPERIAIYAKNKLQVLDPDITWFERDFRKIVEHLAAKGQLKPIVRKRPRKGRGPRL